MNLDDKTIYVFVRGDLAEEQQMVQAAHAVFNMARTRGWPSGEPRIIALDGGSSEKALAKTQRKLGAAYAYNDFVCYVDPDAPERGVTAIATVPLSKEQALPLANYRLRRYSAVVQEQNTTGLATKPPAEVGGSSPSGGASS